MEVNCKTVMPSGRVFHEGKLTVRLSCVCCLIFRCWGFNLYLKKKCVSSYCSHMIILFTPPVIVLYLLISVCTLSQQSSTRRQPFPAALRFSVSICNNFPFSVCPSTTWPVLNDTSFCWLVSPKGQNSNHSNISFHFIHFLYASCDAGGESLPG